MARRGRRRRQNVPVMETPDAHQNKDLQAELNADKRHKTLSNFGSALRQVKDGSAEWARALRKQSAAKLQDLGLEPDSSKVHKRRARGSGQVNGDALTRWIDSVDSTDKHAVNQLQTLYATANARLGV